MNDKCDDWDFNHKEVIIPYSQQLADKDAEIARLRLAAVRAVLPLEAMNIAGLEGRFPPEVIDGIKEGIAAVRAALGLPAPVAGE